MQAGYPGYPSTSLLQKEEKDCAIGLRSELKHRGHNHTDAFLRKQETDCYDKTLGFDSQQEEVERAHKSTEFSP
ncbi:MAG: hypothetical protein QXW39_07975 [Candidatus Bathyarchaeia archaeon]